MCQVLKKAAMSSLLSLPPQLWTTLLLGRKSLASRYLVPFTDKEEAIELVNATDYGLGNSV
jgi:hypothetical protein